MTYLAIKKEPPKKAPKHQSIYFILTRIYSPNEEVTCSGGQRHCVLVGQHHQNLAREASIRQEKTNQKEQANRTFFAGAENDVR